MIYKEHYIELFVNNQQVELDSQKSLNLRIQNVIFNPEKIASTSAEYSFEFNVPSTPINDRIFDYANNLAKLNKFRTRYNAVLYADGTVIFEGTLIIESYKDKHYSCNLVQVKQYNLEELFGDSTLNMIKWDIPFEGGGSGNNTIDYYNSQVNAKVTFPLVCYGAFQKTPLLADAVSKSYSSKFNLDSYNRWYVESFYPSLNMLETLKKTFEYKGYTVAGDAFNDAFLSNIFMSVNLADGQSPTYNLGNEKFGKVKLTVDWETKLDVPATTEYFITTGGESYGTVQDLKFPYACVRNAYYSLLTSGQEISRTPPEYNFEQVKIYNMLSPSDGNSTVSITNQSYMYQKNENLIVIPSDGFYKIKLEYSAELMTTSAMTAKQKVRKWDSTFNMMSNEVEEKEIQFLPDFAITTPLEIQLVRNYDDNLELIKGKTNFLIHDGYPNNETEMNKGRKTNYEEYDACFPHEPQGIVDYFFHISPTEMNDLSDDFSFGTYGYMPADGELFCYDPAVSDIFIAGATSMGGKQKAGTAAAMKNGYSWSKSVADRFDNFYIQDGYYQGNYDVITNSAVYTRTTYNKNEFENSPYAYHFQSGRKMNGVVYCMMNLKKNDVLQLLAVHREYEDNKGNQVTYQTKAKVKLEIEAASPSSYADLKAKGFGYYSPNEFSYNLQLGNFLNKEKKMSDWANDIIKAFNLEIIQDNKNIFINKRKKTNKYLPTWIDIDDRVNSRNAEIERIAYPASMAVKYKIDTDEWGFERSVFPQSKLNEEDWKDYGDSGFTVVSLNDDNYETSKDEISINSSYCWYDSFIWYPVTSDFSADTASTEVITLKLPVISKYTYMIDGYDYEESMKHDGYGLPQRFWFRPERTDAYVWLRTDPVEKVQVYIPNNQMTEDGSKFFNLSYKTSENSILTEFFNITPYLSSNYVKLDVYLTPEEYKAIKNGCLVSFDKDIYIPIEIEGFDVSGSNPTTLKLIKKV